MVVRLTIPSGVVTGVARQGQGGRWSSASSPTCTTRSTGVREGEERARDAEERDRVHQDRRPGRLQVLLVGGAPLPRRVLAPVGLRDLHGLRHGQDRANPRRLGHLQHHRASTTRPGCAERVAMLDHLGEGRFEFGTGRGSSSTEVYGFSIDNLERPGISTTSRSPRSCACGRRTSTPTTATASRCRRGGCCPSPTPTPTRRSGWRPARPARSRRRPAWASASSASPWARPTPWPP